MKRFGFIIFILTTLFALTQILRSPLAIRSYQQRFLLGLDGFRSHSVPLKKNTLQDSIEIRYVAGGFGPPIVLIHGLIDNKESWANVLPILGKSHRVIAIDLPGHGESEPQHTPVSIELLLDGIHTIIQKESQIAEKVIKQLERKRSKGQQISRENRSILTTEEQLQINTDFSKLVLVGHGLGAWLVSEYSLQHPESIKQVFLVNPQGSNIGIVEEKIIPTTESQIADKMQHVFGREIWLPNFVVRDLLIQHEKSSYRDLFNESLGLLPLEKFIGTFDLPVSEMQTQQGKEGVQENSQSPKARTTEYKDDRKIAVDIIWGEPDEIFDKEMHGTILASQSPSFVIHPLQNCGHAPQYGCPVILSKKIEQLLEE